jgi:hypothetical protein
MEIRSALLLAAMLAIAPLAAAQPKAPAPAEGTVAAKIEALAWMKGYWTGEGYGGTVETMMTPPRAGVMIGTFRHMKADGKPGFYEICSIEEYEGSLRFIIKHFHPSWVGWEEKDRALQARLIRQSKDEWQFSNMLLRRTGRDAIVLEITVTPRDGAPRKEVLRFRRQPL